MSRFKRTPQEKYSIKLVQDPVEAQEKDANCYLDLSAFICSPRKSSPSNEQAISKKENFLSTPNLKRKEPELDDAINSPIASDCSGLSDNKDPELTPTKMKIEDSNESGEHQISFKMEDSGDLLLDVAHKKAGRLLRAKGKFWVNYEDMDRDEQSARDETLLNGVPTWAKRKCHLDSRGRPVGAADHDPKTLFIPPDELNRLTPMLKQYWRIKRDGNFNKIVLFKKGNFYQALYEDAIDCYKILNYALKNSQLLVGVPEQNIDWAVEKLISADFEVAIVDEIENYKESRERTIQMRKEKIKVEKDDQLMQREVVEIKSRGVSINYSSGEEKYLLAIFVDSNGEGPKAIAIAAMELYQRKLYLGVLGAENTEKSDKELNSILYQTKPSEILLAHAPTELMRKLGQLCPSSKVTRKKLDAHFWNPQVSLAILEREQGSGEGRGISGIDYIKPLLSNESAKYMAFSAFSGILNHLKDHLVLDKYVSLLKFYPLRDIISPLRNKKLFLDGQTLLNLDISKDKGGIQEGSSLLGKLNKTGTNSGRRLMKKWVENPLFDLEAIEARLDAIEALEARRAERENFRIQIKLLGDLEYMTHKLAAYSVRKDRVNINYYLEDRSISRLKELKALLLEYHEASKLISSCFGYKETFSSRLAALITDETISTHHGISGLLPNIEEKVKIFRDMIIWHEDIPIPKNGFSPDYDSATDRIKVIQGQLNDHLQEVKKEFKDETISFVKVKKRYEIEVSELTLKKKQSSLVDWEPTSMKAGFKRFHSPFVRAAVDEIEELEVKLKYLLSEFALKVFKLFASELDTWERFCSVLSELDCLCTLSHFSFSNSGFSRPILLPPATSFAENLLELENFRHPCLLSKEFVPNSIKMDGTKRTLILTGPNMGGKSTLMRSACLNVIMAQIGVFVPASLMKLTLVDQIYTKMQSFDSFSEGKSTFFLEMEQTLAAVKGATMNSFLVFDELGRGTSTSDGVAIATAILSYTSSDIKCKTLFATHFHDIVSSFQTSREVQFYFMDHEVNEQEKTVHFKYRLKQGVCEKSQGIKVARLAGIPESVLESAERKKVDFAESQEVRASFDRAIAKLNDFIMTKCERGQYKWPIF